ncbi:MAG: histidine kinase, partial [Pseudomonadota bacterium]
MVIEVSTLGSVWAGVLLATLIGVAGFFLYRGIRAQRGAAATLAANARLEALLAVAPALAMVVRADGRLELPDRLADWFGLSSPPRYLADLAGGKVGLTPDDAAALATDVAAAQKAGRNFKRTVRAQGSSRTLMIQGVRAPRDLQAPGGVVWVFDATESQAEIARLGEEGSDIRGAFDALTGLIEAAPLPMWYRGADLRLAMVNSAYVEAVEGADAEDVVRRGVELVEGSGVGGPLASAVLARDTDMPQMQAMPATIR